MPSLGDLNEKAEFIFNRSQLPGVCGLIDGTHISIQRPTEHEEAYINRKFYPSINVRILCLSSYKITDVCARWPGSCHDSWILRNSAMHEKFDNGTYPGFTNDIILGDSGYPCTSWLITPLLAHPHIIVSTIKWKNLLTYITSFTLITNYSRTSAEQ